MRYAEAHPQSWIKAKILILGGGGTHRTVDPGVSGAVAFHIYRNYYRKLKQDVLGFLTKTYILYSIQNYTPGILYGHLTATVSQNSTAVYL